MLSELFGNQFPFLATGVLLASMALSEDVFGDAMPPCEKLYNAQEALQSRFRELVSSRYYQSL